MSHCSDDFEFRIEAVIPVGLTGEGQRSMHTNVIGRIARGSVKVGDLVLVPWKGGAWRPVAVKGLMTQHDAPDRFPAALLASSHQSYACCLSLRVAPGEANQIDFETRPLLRGRV